MKKKVSVLIVNWNGMKTLPECLAALRVQRFTDFETIVVDNGSSDDSRFYLWKLRRFIIPVFLDSNLGFTGGNLEAYRYAQGEYIALLNNDAVPSRNWLAALTTAMGANSRLGTCASKLVRYDNPLILDAAGDGCTASGSAYKRGEGQPASLFEREEYIFGACAAAVLYRRKMLDDAGFFDPDFYLNAEDSDLNFRAQLAGWRCLYVPSAEVRHHVSASIKRLERGSGVYYSLRNDEFVWLKNMPVGLMFRFCHHKLVREISTFIHYGILKGSLGPYLRAKWDALTGLPGTVRKRWQVQAKKRVPDEYLAGLMTSNFKMWYEKQTRARRAQAVDAGEQGRV